MEYELTKSDYQDLEVIFRISSSVLENYVTLSKLEIENKKNSLEFTLAIERLASSQKLLKQLLDNYTSNFNKVTSTMEYLKKELETYGSTLSIVAGSDYGKLEVLRIFSYLRNYYLDNTKRILLTTLPDDLKNLLSQLEEMDSIVPLESIIKSITLPVLSIERDQSLFFISKLEQKIKSPYFKLIRSELIKAKYNLAFIDPNIEETLLENEFNAPDEICFSSDLVVGINKLDVSLFLNLKKLAAHSTIGNKISTILDIKDVEYKDSKVRTLVELNEIALRGALQLLTDEDINNSNEAFHDIIDDNKEFQNGSYDMSIEKIQDAFRALKHDKVKIYRIQVN